MVPDAPGWWLRVNGRGNPVLHHIFETDGTELSLEAGLWITWATPREGIRLMHPSEDVHGRYYWCGPLPECPE